MSSKYHSRNLDHLGIVSQICDDIGIVKAIDKMMALLTESVKVRPRQTVINNSTSYIFVRFRTSKDHFVPEDEALEPAKV